MAGRRAAEQSHEEAKANISSTLFDFYVQSVLGRGSLAFLGPKCEITLAEVWEAVMDMLKGAGYSEDELEAHYFDDETRAALARGKEHLVKVRAETMEGENPEKEAPLISPVPPSTLADIDIIGSSSHSPLTAKVVTEITSAQGGDEGEESTEAQAYEVDVRKPTSPGNFNADLAQVDCSFASYEFDELLDYFLNLNEPLSPLFTDFNFFSSVEKVLSIVQTSPPPVIPPPSLQATLPSASQPGS